VTSSAPVVCADLDRTLIYSPSALALDVPDALAPRLLCVEVYRGAPLSFLTEAAAEDLVSLAGAAVLVPTTSRLPEQLARVHLPGPPARYAIASNGGHLLVDGVQDVDWTARVRRAVSSSAPVQAVHEHVRAVGLPLVDGGFVHSLRTASGLFVYAVVERDRVPDGWLEIYHGNRHSTRPGEVGTYYAGAVLLDPNDPARVLRRSPGPFFGPEADFEVAGFVPNVVFPTGVVRDGGTILVYYGAADAFTAVAEFSERELLDAMTTPG